MKEWVYVFYPTGFEYQVKVGCTGLDPLNRLRQLNTGSPHKLKLAYAVLIEASNGFEKRIQRQLTKKKLWMRGEWFECLVETAIIEIRNTTKSDALYEIYNVDKKFILDLEQSESYNFHIESAEKGNMYDQYHTAILYDCAYDGINKNFKRAFYWYLKAAKQGHIESQYNVATMYESGDGVEKNIEKAVTWYLKSSMKGHVDSIYNLKILHENFSLIKNYEADNFWKEILEIGFGTH